MLFNSLPFILLFLPVVLALYRLTGSRKWQRHILLAGSLFFYGWWNPIYVPLLVLSVLFNYGFARRLERRKSVGLLLTAIAFNLLLIGYFKYAGFLAGSICHVLGRAAPDLEIVLPLAISFYTFQQISFVIDCYYRRTEPGSLGEYATYVTFFPQLIAGPIVRHTELAPQLRDPEPPPLSETVVPALTLFTIGLFKKVAFADGLGLMNRPFFDAAAAGQALTGVEAWWAVSTYALQLYFDFSGYSDMAIGLALFFGLRLPVNFRSPYQATTILEFWRRWHITLTGFFTQYLYLPLSMKLKVRSIVGHSLVTLFVMAVVGLWHGAGWNFLIWGAIHGLYMVVARVYSHIRGRTGTPEEPSAVSVGGLLGRFKVFVLLAISYPFFRLPDFESAMDVFKSLFGLSRPDQGLESPVASLGAGLAISSTQGVYFVFLLAVLWWAPSALRLAGFSDETIESSPGKPLFGMPLVWSGLAIGGLLAFSLIRIFVGYESEFLYFQF